jgi:glycerophosphoryl diester phosphodiesterase
MIVLSHRGYWKTPAEKNTEAAFRRSFSLGFGTETDVRDLAGELVISHDPPTGGELTFARLLQIHAEYAGPLPLALNVKSDGLQSRVAAAFAQQLPKDYFFFDMSIPDALGYLQHGLTAFTRHSELEPECSFYERAAGVWIDCFYGDWIDEGTLARHLDAGKQVCLVSPDLHRRDPVPLWHSLASMPVSRRPGLMICTDRPEEAAQVFSTSPT